MFSRKYQLLQKTGPDGIGRYDFLRLLKKEFLETKSEDSKQQVLANLANFAYDPINYEYIQSLQLIELFLELLESNENNTYVEFSIAALCNLSSDSKNREIILNRDGINCIAKHLFSEDEETILNVITTLIFLKVPENITYYLSANIIDKIKELQSNNNSRIANTATIFFQHKLGRDQLIIEQNE